mgnify:CR=1 FL=1
MCIRDRDDNEDDVESVEPNPESSFKRPVTVLKERASMGDKILQVASSAGFKVGQQISISIGPGPHEQSIFEVAIIVKFGSIEVEAPLTMDHEVGASIVALTNPQTVPTLNFNIADSESDSEASDGHSSQYKFGASRTIVIPDPPNYQAEIRPFHVKLLDNIMAQSTRNDDKERDYYNACLKGDHNHPKFDKVPRRHIRLDRIAVPAFEKACQKYTKLKKDIDALKLKLNDRGKQITSRRILIMLYHRLATDKSMLEIVNIRSVSNMDYSNFGDTKAQEFHDTWVDTVSYTHLRAHET